MSCWVSISRADRGWVFGEVKGRFHGITPGILPLKNRQYYRNGYRALLLVTARLGQGTAFLNKNPLLILHVESV
jgi:hypothetical protein